MIKLTTRGFTDSEQLQITTHSWAEAGRQLGTAMQVSTRELLQQLKQNPARYGYVYHMAADHLAWLKAHIATEMMRFNGINWLEAYWDLMLGYAQGTHLTEIEVALLQMEIDSGCQTIILGDRDGTKVRLLHTEEDAANFSLLKDSTYPYLLVNLTVHNTSVSFFAYPGLCSFGAAYGVNQSMALCQVVDDLYIDPAYSRGPWWANLIAFITLGCGSVAQAHTIVERIRMTSPHFFGGHAIHLIEMGNTITHFSFEFAHDNIVEQVPEYDADSWIRAQTNAPINTELYPFSEATTIKETEKDTISEHQFQLWAVYRRNRLLRLGKESKWLALSGEAAIHKGLELLTYPYMDSETIVSAGKKHKIFSGLPSIFTAGYGVLVATGNEVEMVAGKTLPPPQENQPYELQYRDDYPYLETDLWAEAVKRVGGKR